MLQAQAGFILFIKIKQKLLRNRSNTLKMSTGGSNFEYVIKLLM